jgi:hypothetical protein
VLQPDCWAKGGGKEGKSPKGKKKAEANSATEKDADEIWFRWFADVEDDLNVEWMESVQQNLAGWTEGEVAGLHEILDSMGAPYSDESNGSETEYLPPSEEARTSNPLPTHRTTITDISDSESEGGDSDFDGMPPLQTISDSLDEEGDTDSEFGDIPSLQAVSDSEDDGEWDWDSEDEDMPSLEAVSDSEDEGDDEEERAEYVQSDYSMDLFGTVLCQP